MKTLGITALLAIGTMTVNAQDLKSSEVPSELQSAFSKSYANATDVEWEKEMENYKVDFEINKMHHEVWYDTSGKIVKSEMDIEVSKLPSAVTNVIKAKYADYKIDAIEMTEEGSKKTYEVEIEKGWTQERKLVLDANGSILSDVED